MGWESRFARALLIAAILPNEALGRPENISLTPIVDAISLVDNDLWKTSYNNKRFLILGGSTTLEQPNFLNFSESAYPRQPFSAMVGNEFKWRSDDIKSLKKNIIRYPDLYSRMDLCHLWPYEALDEFHLSKDQPPIVIGFIQTGLCSYDRKTGKTLLRSICTTNMTENLFRILGMVSAKLPGGTHVELVDEVSRFTPLRIEPKDDLKCAERSSDPGRTLAIYDLENRNDKAYPKSGLTMSPALKDMEIHFAHSMIESITLFRSNLYYSRGMRLIMPAKAFEATGAIYRRYVPRRLLDMPRTEYNVEAMELYALDEDQENATIYLHVAGIKWVNHKTELKPYYSRCVLRRGETFEQSEGTSRGSPLENDKCSSSSLNEYVMPIDFVYYDGGNCRKLYAFYQYAYRAFEPTDDLASSGSDYKKRPFFVVDWMNFHLKAVLFYGGRLFFFTIGNRVLIERYVRYRGANCMKMLQRIRQLDEHLASEFILKSLRNLRYHPKTDRDFKSQTLPKYQWDPMRFAKLDRSTISGLTPKIEELQLDPPLVYRRELPIVYQIKYKKFDDAIVGNLTNPSTARPATQSTIGTPTTTLQPKSTGPQSTTANSPSTTTTSMQTTFVPTSTQPSSTTIRSLPPNVPTSRKPSHPGHRNSPVVLAAAFIATSFFTLAVFGCCCLCCSSFFSKPKQELVDKSESHRRAPEEQEKSHPARQIADRSDLFPQNSVASPQLSTLFGASPDSPADADTANLKPPGEKLKTKPKIRRRKPKTKTGTRTKEKAPANPRGRGAPSF